MRTSKEIETQIEQENKNHNNMIDILNRQLEEARNAEEADEERRTVTNLLRDAATKAGRKNGEFINNEYNWILLYSRMNRVLDCDFFNTCEFPNTVYFPSLDSLLAAISEIGEDRIKRVLFGVTE